MKTRIDNLQKSLEKTQDEMASQTQKILNAMSEYMTKAKIPHENETDKEGESHD